MIKLLNWSVSLKFANKKKLKKSKSKLKEKLFICVSICPNCPYLEGRNEDVRVCLLKSGAAAADLELAAR